MLARTLGPKRGWIMMSHIGWGGEQTTIYKGVETFPYQTRFKALRGSPEGKAQREQYLLAVDLGRYTNRIDNSIKPSILFTTKPPKPLVIVHK